MTGVVFYSAARDESTETFHVESNESSNVLGMVVQTEIENNPTSAATGEEQEVSACEESSGMHCDASSSFNAMCEAPTHSGIINSTTSTAAAQVDQAKACGAATKAGQPNEFSAASAVALESPACDVIAETP